MQQDPRLPQDSSQPIRLYTGTPHAATLVPSAELLTDPLPDLSVVPTLALVPTSVLTQSPTGEVSLFQKNQRGAVKIWTVKVDPAGEDQPCPRILVTAGLLGGKLTTTPIPVKTGKCIGKKNETSAFEQAMLEAQSRIDKQIQGGYVADLANVKEAGELGSGDLKPMLAEKYDPTGKQKDSRTLAQMGIEGQLIGYQRKKDGNRGGLKIRDGKLRVVSRKGLEFPCALPKLEAALRATPQGARAFAGELGIVNLDGELFTKEVSFNKLNGLLKAFPEKLKAGEQEILDRLVYHLYDIVDTKGYEDREPQLDGYSDGGLIEKMETEYVIATVETLDALREKYEAEGEEGGIIRILGKPYEHRRTWNLVKHVLVFEEEFELLDVLEGVIPGRASKFVFRAPAGATDSKGNPKDTFEGGVGKQTHAESAEMLENKHQYIGLQATVKFRGFSEYGIPRFAKLKGFRNELDLDQDDKD